MLLDPSAVMNSSFSRVKEFIIFNPDLCEIAVGAGRSHDGCLVQVVQVFGSAVMAMMFVYSVVLRRSTELFRLPPVVVVVLVGSVQFLWDRFVLA
jgi:hypothetical protein